MLSVRHEGLPIAGQPVVLELRSVTQQSQAAVWDVELLLLGNTSVNGTAILAAGPAGFAHVGSLAFADQDGPDTVWSGMVPGSLFTTVSRGDNCTCAQHERPTPS
jgi:hypothetical protein